MSKKFKTQDYFRYKKLGKRWRRPVGLQSKLRLRKGGSGMHVAIGYGSPHKVMPLLVRNEKDFEKDCSNGIIFSSTLGSRKTAVLAAKARELNITVLNNKKVRRAVKITDRLGKKQKTEKKKEEAKEKEENKSEVAETGEKEKSKSDEGETGKAGVQEEKLESVSQ